MIKVENQPVAKAEPFKLTDPHAKTLLQTKSQAIREPSRLAEVSEFQQSLRDDISQTDVVGKDGLSHMR